MRHPQLGGPALVPASSLDLHRQGGWWRVSDPIDEAAMDQVALADYTDAPDLDAAPEPAPKPAAKTIKEK